ncbi:hypothetical protein B0W47_16745 (plasmid) [Komagataeibacter nataicola]|uniref:Host nuclease inhibitor protein n=1 Tax=Komagataeibacter nataicola TaxID=265960 RepID=A0A9N7CNY5_9PROT|nr:hypothetical protein [Komagataeibacter nataicola]AQU89228.1 hypothetical protein B0W47_16745 [Komagataeibacter nataicola]PYD66312.1 host nuclease inhibitor protein [Komagataeibacter nataicola]WNM10279.1 host nuclease inhibitor protein [Komagataeibacter nataicola]GBR23496.1 hypothetical protein AA0616_2535 [Komagataeibacter nataicola NRIC 0616]
MYAYCYRGGQIEFGEKMPEGALPLGNDEDSKKLMDAVRTNARLAYDNKTLLVPGIPEAGSDDDALEAWRYFREIIEWRLEGRTGFPERKNTIQ